MDWGFFRGTSKDPLFLRKKLLYPVKFYYFAAVTNLFMRCMWIVPLFRSQYMTSQFGYNQWDVTLLMLIEALRRA
jgi:EXS family